MNLKQSKRTTFDDHFTETTANLMIIEKITVMLMRPKSRSFKICSEQLSIDPYTSQVVTVMLVPFKPAPRRSNNQITTMWMKGEYLLQFISIIRVSVCHTAIQPCPQSLDLPCRTVFFIIISMIIIMMFVNACHYRYHLTARLGLIRLASTLSSNSGNRQRRTKREHDWFDLLRCRGTS